MSYLATFVCFVLGLCAPSQILGEQITASSSVFLIPHQDDEMYLAGGIIRDLQAGKSVYVVLATDGDAARARYDINGKDDNGKLVRSLLDNKIHNPYKEGYTPLTTTTMVAARDLEFVASITDLGVPRDHILFWLSTSSTIPGRARDGRLEQTAAQKLVEQLEKMVGVGTFTTIYPTGKQHADHAALGRGLLQSKIESAKRFYFEGPNLLAQQITLSPRERVLKAKAMSEYFVWKPSAGRFAVGSHSVDERILFWRHARYEYVAKP